MFAHEFPGEGFQDSKHISTKFMTVTPLSSELTMLIESQDEEDSDTIVERSQPSTSAS
jgi:hypothetical protein